MKIIIISGPTASGKSGLAIELAKEINGVIINADSMQVYEGLPILSAQPSRDEQKEAPHKLYGVVPPYKNCSVGKWLDMIKGELEKLQETDQIPIIVGGTGMYIKKLVEGVSPIPDVKKEIRDEASELFYAVGNEEFYKRVKEIDPEYAKKINSGDKQRMIRVYEVFKQTGKNLTEWHKGDNIKIRDDMEFFHINFEPNREWLYERCNRRFRLMVEEMGGLEEVEAFLKTYPDIMKGRHGVHSTLGLIEICDYIKGKISLEEMISIASQKTRNYAKRQYTWFRNQFTEKYIVDENLDKDKITKAINTFLGL